jgi:hypothetical protein
MTIGLQGTWSVSVKSKDASWAQRFVVDGADSGNGTYSGTTGTPAILVSGDQWGVSIENNPTGPVSWRPSRARLANHRVDGAFFKVDIESDDGGGFAGDEDFNDLILTISKPLAASEWIVYGKVKTYGGRCLFNPCHPFPWLVIDTPNQLERLLNYDNVRSILEREYGADVASRMDADTFEPMMLSRGGSNGGGYKVHGATKVEMKKKRNAKKATLHTVDTASVHAADRFDYRPNLTLAEAGILDKLIPTWQCDNDPLGNTVMEFVEYDRTHTELSGGAYTGLGGREIIGLSATDEFGNYVFSFTRTIADLIDESSGDTPVGGDPVTAANPDVMIRFPDENGVVGYSTAPYYDIPNIRKINLCIRKSALAPKACQGGDVLQYIGDIPIVANGGSSISSDGTVTNNPSLSGSGPSVERAAWRGTIDLFGCFGSSQAPVTHYTVQWRVNGGDWEYLNVDASGLRQQGNGLYTLESYGPDTSVFGAAKPAYRNIELEPNWSTEVRHRKAKVRLRDLLNTVPLARKVAKVTLRIHGYDSTGNFVPGTYDKVELRVDEEKATGDIASILVPGETEFNECALIQLPSDNSPLEFKLRALDPDGFLRSWSLTAVKGSNTPVGLIDAATSAAPGGVYPGEIADNAYVGTAERVGADVDGYVTLTLAPAVGNWLGEEEFCGYSFELHVRDRVTNGVTAAGNDKVHDEVVGIREPASE